MVDKNKVMLRFSRAASTYDEHALVQQEMAEYLISMLPHGDYARILELGCGTGYLSALVVNKLRPKAFYLNDISGSMLDRCALRLSAFGENCTFVKGDLDTLGFEEKFHLIISNACLQWVPSLKNTLVKYRNLLLENGIMLFSGFGEDNLIELKSLSGVGLNSGTVANVRDCLSALYPKVTFHEKRLVCHYENALALLSSLKSLGVTGLSDHPWTKAEIIRLLAAYEARYSDKGCVYATWHCYYALLQRS